MNASSLPPSLIPEDQKQDFLEWARDGGYDESYFDRYDSKSRELEQTFLEERESQRASDDLVTRLRKMASEQLFEEDEKTLRAAALQIETLRAATLPIYEVSKTWVDAEGWTDLACNKDRIVDWFGPSDFRRIHDSLKL